MYKEQANSDDDEEIYVVGHNTVTFVIDKAGNKRLAYTGSDWSTANFMEDLEHLLNDDLGEEETSDENTGHEN